MNPGRPPKPSSGPEEVRRAARLVLWAALHPSTANPFVALDRACEALGLDPMLAEDRGATLTALGLDPAAYSSAASFAAALGLDPASFRDIEP